MPTRPSRLSFVRAALAGLVLLLAAGAQGAGAPADWWPDLHNDRADEIRGLLARGADPNVRYQNGQPAIMRAVVDQAWNVFDVLAADPRTDVNAENPAGETPLMYLALTGQTARADKLIARGAQVNRLGWTPLHYAASKGQMDTARLLLRRQAMPNAPSPQGTTPLMMAAYSGSQPMVQLLLDAGADPATRDLKGQDAADWALSGKAGTLSQSLRELIAKVDRERSARRNGQPGAPPAAGPASALPPAGQPAGVAVEPPARPAARAPAAGGAPGEPEAPRMLRGVTGVQLGQ